MVVVRAKLPGLTGFCENHRRGGQAMPTAGLGLACQELGRIRLENGLR